MVSRNEIVYDVLEMLRANLTDDSNIDRRQIVSYVKDYRADFLKQRFDRNPFILDSVFIQPIYNLEVDKVNTSTLSGINSSRYFMKTKKKIPPTIRRKGLNGTLLHVGPVDMLDKSYTITDYATAIGSGNGRFNRDEIFAFIYDGYLYLTSKSDNDRLIYNLTIRGIFTDPAEVTKMNNAAVYTGNEDYYTSRDLKRYIVQSILKDKYGILLNPPMDVKDNGMDNLEKQ